jgi:hypothetical protein
VNFPAKFAGLLSLAAALAVLPAGECRASILSSADLLSIEKCDVEPVSAAPVGSGREDDSVDLDSTATISEGLPGQGGGCGTSSSNPAGGSSHSGSILPATAGFRPEVLLQETLPLSAKPFLPGGSPDDLLRPPRVA